MAHEALLLALRNPGRVGIIAAPTYPMLRDVTRAEFLDVVERNGIQCVFNRTENWLRLSATGSQILFRSTEYPDRLRGPNLAWFAVDELTYCRPGAFQQLQARLRDKQAKALHGLAAFTPKGFDWYYDFFVGQNAPPSERELIRANPFENRPNLAPGYYESLERAYDPQLYKQEVLGEFVSLFAGQAYWAFTRAVNVSEAAYDPALPLWWSWDFNVDPMCSVVCQVQQPAPPQFHGEPPRPLQIRVMDELVIRSSSTQEVLEEFVRRWGEHRAGLVIYGDPAGRARHSVSTKSDWQIIREFFQTRGMRAEFRVHAAAPAVKDRVQAVNAKLANAAGERAIRIAPKCRELIADLERVTWKPGTGQMDKSDPLRTHTSDALGYLVWAEWPLRAAIGEQSRRLM